MGDFEKTKYFYEKAEIFVTKILSKNHPEYCIYLPSLANYYMRVGRYSDAEKYLMKILKIREKVFGKNHYSLAHILSALSNLYIKTQKHGKAEEMLKKVIEINKNRYGIENYHYAYALINIGLLYMIEKEYSYAESNFMEALRIYNLISFEDCIDYPFLLSKIFTLYHITGRYDEAETIFDQTSNIFYRIVERYFAGMSDKEKTNLLDKINDFYEEYNSFAIDRLSETPHIIGKLYEKRLQTKGLLYTAGNSIKNNLLKSKDSILLGKYNSWISIKEYLAGLITNRSDKIRKNKNYIDSLIDVANSMEKELARYSSSFNSYKMKSLFTDYKWENIRNKLDSNEASIEIIRFRYFSDTFSENIYYAFIIVTKGTKDYPDIVILKDGNKLENECLSGYKRGLQKNDLHNSFKRYWEKVDLVLDKYFKNNEERKLFIANDGVYNQINVGALMPVKNKFLIQKYDIRNIRSTREIVESKNNEKTFFSFDKKAVIFGAPNYSKNMIANTAQGKMAVKNKINIISDKVLSVNSLIKRSGLSNKTFEKLPGAEKEIKEISKILSSNGWDVSLFSGDNASEEEVKSIQNPNILHLAIHGLFMEDIKTSSKYYNFNERILLDDPMYRSMLFFSGVNDILSGNRVKNKTQDSYSGEDGILTAKEIQNLSLDSSELVVVAACQSGKGVLRNMEGIYGMERAFFLSGAKNVIVSLWLVDDLIASDLMIRFYRNWMKCNDKHKAFRKAQLELIENGTKSYDWAVFMMIGM
jgi:CHAT domain-containing protein/tetratricopeptide (TPR) repeat protein